MLLCYAIRKTGCHEAIGFCFFVEAGGMAPEAGPSDGLKTGNKRPG